MWGKRGPGEPQAAGGIARSRSSFIQEPSVGEDKRCRRTPNMMPRSLCVSREEIFRSGKWQPACEYKARRIGIASSDTVYIRGAENNQSAKDKKKLTEVFSNIRLIDDRYRLYVDGHGDWKNQTLAGWTPDAVASLFKECEIPFPEVVSVTACSLARDLVAVESNTHRVGQSANSFAAMLQKLLDTLCGHKTVVYARAYDTGNWDLKEDPDLIGRKSIFLSDDAKCTSVAAKETKHTKMKFYWEGSTQMRVWADDLSEVKPD